VSRWRLVAGLALEGCCDFFFGRPLDENPYSRAELDSGHSWRCGWLEACWLARMRGDREWTRWVA
jgi:hypothetical protein